MSGGNTGRLFAELDASGSGVIGTIGLHDDTHGVIVFTCSGRLDGDRLELACTPPLPAQAGEPGVMQLSGAVEPDGQIMGSWTAAGGGEGSFVLFPDRR